MNLPCKTAAETLSASPIAGLLRQAELLGRISVVVADFTRETTGGQPPPQPPRCAIHGTEVLITLFSPAQAAKLRQRTTALTGLLRQCEPKITGFRLRLQPGEPDDLAPPTAPVPTQSPPSRETLAAALQFADDLCGLQDSPLRTSAQRLRSALARRLRETLPERPPAGGENGKGPDG